MTCCLQRWTVEELHLRLKSPIQVLGYFAATYAHGSVHNHLDIHGSLHGLARGAEGPNAGGRKGPARCRRHLLHLQPWWTYRVKVPRQWSGLLYVPVLGLLWQQLKNGHVVEARRRLEAVEPSSHLAALRSQGSLGSVELDIKNLFFQKPACSSTSCSRRRSVARELMIVLDFESGFANWMPRNVADQLLEGKRRAPHKQRPPSIFLQISGGSCFMNSAQAESTAPLLPLRFLAPPVRAPDRCRRRSSAQARCGLGAGARKSTQCRPGPHLQSA